MIKKITALVLILTFSIFPNMAQAITLYSYTVGPDGETVTGQGEYETDSSIEKIAEEAAEAVVIIDGFKTVPAYEMNWVRDAETGRYAVSIQQTGTSTKRVSSGSGFFVTSDGYIMTNRHVVDDPRATYTVDLGSAKASAQVIYKDSEYDLAVIKIVGQGFPAVTIAGSSDVRVGDEIVSVGNALGKFVDSISFGHIISLNERVVAREGNDLDELNGLIATDARLYPGDSGGPLLNSNGEAIGVNVAILAGTNISFSIPGEVVKMIVKKAGINI